MGIWGLILSTNPMITGPAAEQAEAAIGASQNAALMTLCPLAGVALQTLDVITRNNGAQHPLFKPENDNAQAAPADENKPVPYDLDRFDYDQLLTIAGNVLDNLDTADPQLALQAMQKAGESDLSGGEEYNLLLGKACLATGNGYGAAQAFSAYLETNPGDQDVIELRLQANRMDLSVLDADGDGNADNEADAEEVNGLQGLLLADEAVLVSNDFEGQYFALGELENELILADFSSEDEGLEALKGLEAVANRYVILGSVTLDDSEHQESLRNDTNMLAARTYEVAASYAELSPYEGVSRRAPLYKALGLLAQGEIETAEEELKKIRADFPEAEAIVSRMEADRRRDVNKQALEVWKNFIDEREQKEISDHNSILGHTLGFATWAASGGDETGISRCHDKWNLQRDVLDAVEKKLNKGDAKTLKEALQAVVDDADGRISPAAQTLLNDIGNTGWGTGYRLDAVSFLVGYTDALESGDEAAAKEYANHLYENADHLTIMDGAAQTAYGLYGLLEATTGDEAFAAKCGEKMTELETGNKSIAGFIWDEIRTTGTDDLAAMAIMGGAAKIGRGATFKAYRYLRKAGWSVTKARYAAIGAGFAAEANAFWAMNTLYQASTHDASQVFTTEHLLKSYGANLITLGVMKGFGAVGGGAGKAFAAKSPRIQFVLSHSFALGGMVAGNQVNHALGLAQAPRGGFKESVVRDVFGYFKYAAGPRVFATVFPAKAAAPRPAPEPAKAEPKVEAVADPAVPVQAHAAAKQSPLAKALPPTPKAKENAKPLPEESTVVTKVTKVTKVADKENIDKAVHDSEMIVDAQMFLSEPKAQEAHFAQRQKVGPYLYVFNEPAIRARLNALAERPDAVGESARLFREHHEKALRDIERFNKGMEEVTSMRANPKTPREAWMGKLGEMLGLWKEVRLQTELLKMQPHNKLEQAFNERSAEVRKELDPLRVQLTRLHIAPKGSEAVKSDIVVTVPERLTLDPADPARSVREAKTEDMATVEITTSDPQSVISRLQKAGVIDASASYDPARTTYPVKTSGGKMLPVRFVFDKPAPAPAKSEPVAAQPATKSPLLPQNALFGVSGPVGLYGLLTSQGVPQSVAMVISGAALALPVLGMVWGSRPKPQPIVPNPNGIPVSIQDSPFSPARLVVAPTRNGGLILFDGPVGTARGGVTVNGRPMTYQWQNGMYVKPGDVIEVGGRSYEIMPPANQPAHAAALQAGSQGYPPAPGAEPAPGQVVRATGKNGSAVLIAIEGAGRAPGQRAADAEAQAAMSDWIRQGYGLDVVVPGGRRHVQQSFLKDDGTVRAGAPKVDAAGVEIVFTPEGYQATFVRDGKVEAAVIRLGDAKEAIFQAPEGKSSPDKPLRDGDVVVMGKFAEGLQSMWIVRDIIKRSGVRSADVIQAALGQESAIRSKILEIAKTEMERSGRSELVIEHRHYALAYESVMGQKPQFGYAGYYEGGYVLKPTGEVVSVRDGKMVDKFAAAPMPFQVQIVGR